MKDEMMPIPPGLSPERFVLETMEMTLSGPHYIWLRIVPMAMPEGVTVTVQYPDRATMTFSG